MTSWLDGGAPGRRAAPSSCDAGRFRHHACPRL